MAAERDRSRESFVATVIKLDPSRWQRAIEAFTQAVDQTRDADREQYLTGVLGDDPALLAEVRAMLRAHESPDLLQIEKRLISADADSNLSGD